MACRSASRTSSTRRRHADRMRHRRVRGRQPTTDATIVARLRSRWGDRRGQDRHHRFAYRHPGPTAIARPSKDARRFIEQLGRGGGSR
jgi:hypothetical protein